MLMKKMQVLMLIQIMYIYDKSNKKIELSLDRKDRIAKKIIEHII